jgi:hypothetical protein
METVIAETRYRRWRALRRYRRQMRRTPCTEGGWKHDWCLDYKRPTHPAAPSYPGYSTPFGDHFFCPACGARAIIDTDSGR